MIEPLTREEGCTVIHKMMRCKALGRTIKAQRTPPWPLVPTVDLPPRELADELLSAYLRTFETVYRILHVPSFKRDYDAMWVASKEPDIPFVIQLKLVLAIGATVHDEQFSLRSSAIKWVYEALTWSSHPNFKSHFSIQSIQTSLLLLLARETANVGDDGVWISIGPVLRNAVCMGLHRDPAHLQKRTLFDAEMRRRLWNTILELAVQSSLAVGGPVLLSLRDFDTQPPGNFADDQLEATEPLPEDEEHFTQMTTAIALRKTFPIRLAVANFLNEWSSSGTYEETLKLDSELRISYRELCRMLQKFSPKLNTSPSQFERKFVEFLMLRYFLSLHTPFFTPALHETAYAFSRKAIVDSSLKIWGTAYPSSSIMAARIAPSVDSSAQDDFARLTICGAGFLRTVPLQAAFCIALEIRAQLNEEDGLGPAPLRSDLLSVVYDARNRFFQIIEAGETNVKGYLLIVLAAAHIEAIMGAFGKTDMPGVLARAAEEAEKKCIIALEQNAGTSLDRMSLDDLDQLLADIPTEEMEGWDFWFSEAAP